jgi:cytochrome c6
MTLMAMLLLAQMNTPSPAPVTAKSDPADIYSHRCTFCHGDDGRAQTKKGKELKATDFTSDHFQHHMSDEKIVRIITNGIKKKKMPAFKDRLSPEEIQAMVPYLRAFGAQK